MSAFLETFRQDLRFAFRNLWKSPGFLAVVILSLALGIAANSTIFSVINAVMYRPMPYPHPERLVVIWETQAEKPDSLGSLRPSPSCSTGRSKMTFSRTSR